MRRTQTNHQTKIQTKTLKAQTIQTQVIIIKTEEPHLRGSFLVDSEYIRT